MSHYWTGDDHEASRKAQIEDWIADLIEFGPELVSIACGEWRRSQTRRPTIADLRPICIENRAHRAPHAALPARESQERINDARARVMQMSRARDEAARLHREAFAADLGYRSFGYMMEIGLVRAVREAPNYRGGNRQEQAPHTIAADLGVTAREIGPQSE